MARSIPGRLGYVLTNIVVMVILHGNSRQFWPKIPLLSIRDESVGEHVRLLFNTLAVSTALEAAATGLPRERWAARAATLAVIPAALPALLFFGHRVLGLKDAAAERYHLALIPLLPVAAVAVEEALATRGGARRPGYEHLV